MFSLRKNRERDWSRILDISKLYLAIVIVSRRYDPHNTYLFLFFCLSAFIIYSPYKTLKIYTLYTINCYSQYII